MIKYSHTTKDVHFNHHVSLKNISITNATMSSQYFGYWEKEKRKNGIMERWNLEFVMWKWKKEKGKGEFEDEEI